MVARERLYLRAAQTEQAADHAVEVSERLVETVKQERSNR
jgi:hypothetical protein